MLQTEKHNSAPRENNHLRLMLDGIAIGAALWNNKNELIEANERFYEILGLHPKAVEPPCDIVKFSEMMSESEYLMGRSANEILGTHVAITMRGKDSKYIDSWPNGMFVLVRYRRVGNDFWLVSYEDITEAKIAEEETRRLANHDSLTQLFNRRFFHEKLKESLARGRHISVISIDLDRFKEVNDTLGHPFGDVILKTVSQRLVGCFRRSDIVARLGGDEFAAIISGSDEKAGLMALAKRIISTLSGAYMHAGHRVSIGASIGIARSEDGAMSPDILLARSDMALYAAKRAGKGCAIIFENGMDDDAKMSKAIEEELFKALQNKEMHLAYQPIIDTFGKRVAGAEALLRWDSPLLGSVPPERFIAVAEASGQIIELGKWVIETAIADAAQWKSGAGVSINISPAQFCDDSLYETVKNAIMSSKISPDKITLEVTESVLVKNNQSSKNAINKLRELGVKIALDDFGTGYSSLLYLVEFKFDKIKIDKSFIGKIGGHSESETIIRSIIRMTSEMGMELIAEGVENKEQLQWLSENNCNLIQGFLFSRPVSSQKISQWRE